MYGMRCRAYAVQPVQGECRPPRHRSQRAYTQTHHGPRRCVPVGAQRLQRLKSTARDDIRRDIAAASCSVPGARWPAARDIAAACESIHVCSRKGYAAAERPGPCMTGNKIPAVTTDAETGVSISRRSFAKSRGGGYRLCGTLGFFYGRRLGQRLLFWLPGTAGSAAAVIVSCWAALLGPGFGFQKPGQKFGNGFSDSDTRLWFWPGAAGDFSSGSRGTSALCGFLEYKILVFKRGILFCGTGATLEKIL